MKPIEGFENLYSVTSCGKVWSHKRNKFIAIQTTKRGYKTVVLYKDGKSRNYRVNRLVAQAYIPNPLGLPEVDHINEDKNNNSINNLRWVSSAENKANSNANKGKRCRKQVQCVETGEIFKSCAHAARAVGVCKYCINCCVNGKQNTSAGYHWRWVDEV